MAMNKTVMKDLIKAKIQAIFNFPVNGESPLFTDDRVLEAMCDGIIEHIKGTMEVHSVVAVTYVAGVTSGSQTSAGGPGIADSSTIL